MNSAECTWRTQPVRPTIRFGYCQPRASISSPPCPDARVRSGRGTVWRGTLTGRTRRALARRRAQFCTILQGARCHRCQRWARARMISAVAQPPFLQAFWPTVHKLLAPDPDGSRAKHPRSRLLRCGLADVLLICPDKPACLRSARRPATAAPSSFPLLYDSHTPSQCGRGSPPEVVHIRGRCRSSTKLRQLTSTVFSNERSPAMAHASTRRGGGVRTATWCCGRSGRFFTGRGAALRLARACFCGCAFVLPGRRAAGLPSGLRI
jgi:hypothetical protein